jgi:DUF218 domain
MRCPIRIPFWTSAALAIGLGSAASFTACSQGLDHPSSSGDHDAGEPADAGSDAGDAGDAVDAGLPPTDAGACLSAPAVDAGGFSASYTMLSSGSYEQDKAYYLLTVFQSDPQVLAAFAADPVLSASSSSHDALLRSAPTTCGADVACYATALELTDADVQAIAGALPSALSALLPELAAAHLRPSGLFALFAGGTDDALVSAAWSDTAAALNASYDGYAATLDPAALKGVVSDVIAANPDPMPFFAPLLEVVLGALIAQGRDEATLYEPLAAGENQAALAALPSVDWSAYPYTVILVPGQGPTSLSVPLDPQGQARCDLAAARFAAKYAPFVALSGGHVHPDKTPYCEALEMKQYMMTVKGIPESAILVDPYARHTTTNVRNVSRELFRYGIPVDRPALVTSDIFQSLEIGYPAGLFDMNSESTLFYLPYRALVPLSPNDTCLLPSPLTLTGNGRDPLDP